MDGIILTSYFSAKQHPQLGDPHIEGVANDGRVWQNDISYIKRWYDSINKLELNGVVIHDNLSDAFVEKFTTDHVQFHKVPVSEYSNNDYRFFCFRDWLRNHPYDWVFHNDGSDVTVVQNPSKLIEDNPEYDYYTCKDTWLLSEFPYLNFHRHFNWQNYMTFAMNQASWDLINMGVVGGKYDKMLEFYTKFAEVRESMEPKPLNSDMWILQYLLRDQINHRGVLIGEPVTSIYKGYESDRKDVYFIHK